MIFNTTYVNEDFNTSANTILGKSYSFWERIKNHGIGSSRMMILQKSKQLDANNQHCTDITYGNIELRPKGIIVHFSDKLQRFAWVIPFYKLHIYNSETYSIHADGNFIKFKKDNNYTKNKQFLSKMIDAKINFLQLGYYDR